MLNDGISSTCRNQLQELIQIRNGLLKQTTNIKFFVNTVRVRLVAIHKLQESLMPKFNHRNYPRLFHIALPQL